MQVLYRYLVPQYRHEFSSDFSLLTITMDSMEMDYGAEVLGLEDSDNRRRFRPAFAPDKDTEDLTGLLDQLGRDSNISRYVDVPSLIVCGDQSSGKSSVLEGL